MKEKLEDINRRLAAIGNELNSIPRESGGEIDARLNEVCGSIHQAVEGLEWLVELS